MKAKLTSDEAKKIVEFYFANGNSPTAAARLFNAWTLSLNIPTRVSKKNVIDVIKRFNNPAFLMKGVKEHAYKKTTDETILAGVINSLYQQRGSSIRKCAEEMDLSVGTTHTIARSVLKLYPYRLILVQKLSEFDKIVRVEACRRLLQVLTDDKLVVYSDECTFYTDGHVNRWNCRIWDWVRPEDFCTETSQSAATVTVWAGMTENHLFGPYFFPSTVTGDSYRAILCEFFLPNLLESLGNAEEVWFHQDGAPAHVAKDTKAFLSSVFGTNIISRDFQHEWPPRSPDLTPCDFYLWGAVKELVFENGGFENVNDMKESIIHAFRKIHQERMEDVNSAVRAVPSRMEKCISLCGCQLIHC
jgi:hypothetical protein